MSELSSSPAASSLHLRLPATSANLGPGFDAAGLAMSLFLDLEAELADEFAITASGRDTALVGSTTNNLMLMTYSEVLASQGLAAPPLRLQVTNAIPLGMGCGSSAAALCAGVLLANHFGGLQWSAAKVMDEAARREGHPDNVAACLLGGMTVSRTLPATETEASRTLAATFGRDLPWRLLLALPRQSLSTKTARALLPETYSRADCVLNVQATALLVSAFAQGRPELLAAATEDRLHQPYRLAVCPLLERLLRLRGTPGVWSVTLSGAGPAVLLVVDEHFASAQARQAAGTELLAELLELRIAGGVQDGADTASK